MEIFVPDYEWNTHYRSVEEAVATAHEWGELNEGEEFKMVRLTVGACTTYKIVDGKAVPVSVSFPTDTPSNSSLEPTANTKRDKGDRE